MIKREDDEIPLYPVSAANDETAATEAAGILGPRRFTPREQFRGAWAWHWQHNRRFVMLTAATAGSALLHAAGRFLGVW